MAFLGLVGAPATRLTYQAYKALKALSPAAAELFAATDAAAVASILGTTAAVLGAGALGYFVGDAILKGLENPNNMPDMGEYFELPSPNQRIRVVYDYYVDGNPVFIDAQSQIIFTPAKGIFFSNANGDSEWYFLDKDNVRQTIAKSTNKLSGTNLTVKNFIFIDAPPTVPTKRLPSYVPTRPNPLAPATPVTIPLPGIDPFPITPTPVETPANDPNEDDKYVEPGVTIKVPELGLQVQYTPTGVRIGRYTDDDVKKYAPPPNQSPPPHGKAAEEPCPCPEPKDKSAEIICRIKTLQKELLDDGYTTETHLFSNSDFFEVFSLPDEFYRLEVDVLQTASKTKTQLYPGDGTEVIWSGWLSWVYGTRKSERIALQFNNQGYKPPPECTGFVLTMNYGCRASALALTRKKKDYVDTCATA